jgi:L-gulonate 3-dehydrogenase
MKVAVIGAGLIGRAWAIVFARGGNDVALYDAERTQAEQALKWAGESLAEMAACGLVERPDVIHSRISIAASLVDALAGAGFVQENIAERLEAKQALFAEIEAIASGDCILASSSSAIMPSKIFAKLNSPARALVVHPLNPPHLAPIAELCGSPETSRKTIGKTSQLMRLCGMVDVIVEKEIAGFILNRLQHAVLNETFRLIEGGYVSPAGLDKTIKAGLGLRWAFMGPVETIDLNAPGGVRDYMARYGATIRAIGQTQKASVDWTDAATDKMEAACRELRPLESLADAQAWRDRMMMALVQHKKNHKL